MARGESSPREVHVVGIRPGRSLPGDPDVLGILEGADLLVGREEFLAPWKHKTTLVLKGGIDRIVNRVREVAEDGGSVAIMASGDPNFFGIASVLRRSLEGVRVVVHPEISSMQVAFSRIGERWDDARFFSAHARPLGEIVQGLRSCDKACVLTSDGGQPAALARELMRQGQDGFRVYLCEELGGLRENVEEVSLEELSGRECLPLNLLVMLRREPGRGAPAGVDALLGLPDALFATPPGRSGRMTKRELRAVAVSLLMLGPSDILWDIGAGSGALSVEAARLLRDGTVYAVEEDGEDIEVIRENARRFGASNLRAVKGSAPEVFDALPDPDAVFVGGSGGKLQGILRAAAARLRGGGRLVCNLVGLERVQAAMRSLGEAGMACEASLLQVSRLRRLGDAHILDPLNPVFVVYGEKGVER